MRCTWSAFFPSLLVIKYLAYNVLIFLVPRNMLQQSFTVLMACVRVCFRSKILTAYWSRQLDAGCHFLNTIYIVYNTLNTNAVIITRSSSYMCDKTATLELAILLLLHVNRYKSDMLYDVNLHLHSTYSRQGFLPYVVNHGNRNF